MPTDANKRKECKVKKGNQNKSPDSQLNKARALIRPSLEVGERVNCEKLSKEYGIGEGTVKTALQVELARRETLEEAGVAPWTKTAKEKIDAAIRQHKKKLEFEFNSRVVEEVRKRIEQTVLPSLLAREAQARLITKSRKGIMNREDYIKVLSCLHPDRVMDESLKRRYEEAFHLFKGLELLLVSEKEMPVTSTGLPKTWSELMARRKKARGGAKMVRVR